MSSVRWANLVFVFVVKSKEAMVMFFRVATGISLGYIREVRAVGNRFLWLM